MKTGQGKKALVTGGGSGIGRAISLRLAGEGYRVTIADIREERLQETLALITSAGGEPLTTTADIARESEVERLVETAVKDGGGLDVLVNNAGVSTGGFIESVADEEIARVLGVNLIGVIRMTRRAVPYLKASGHGRIVNIASVEGLRGSGLLPVYGASKAGVVGLTRSNAVELARYNITVNAVCPGPIETEMLAPLLMDEQHRAQLIKGIPLRRLGKPEDVAAAVAFLASEDAAFITGQVLVVDGGLTMKA